MKYDQQELLRELKEKTEDIITRVNWFRNEYSSDELHKRPHPLKWSAAECLEHLNLYGDYYLPALQKGLAKGQREKWFSKNETYSSGWFGEFFTKQMELKPNGDLKGKMAAPKDKNPALLTVPENVMERFLQQQDELLGLLIDAQKLDWEKTRIPISIAKWFRLKLGDTFRFLIAHNQRHVTQAEKTLEMVSGKNHIAKKLNK